MAGATATKSTALAVAVAVQSVDELMRLAEILYKGGANQLANVDRPEKVFHLILFGREIGLNYTQSLASLAMGKTGRITIMGDGALALVMQSGLLEDIKEFWEGEGDSRKGVCVVKRKGFPDPRRFEFTTAQAEQAGLIKRAKNEKGDGPWLAYRDRMLRYRPLGYALRDVFPDVLKGLHLTEEVADPVPDSSIVHTEVRVTGTTADRPSPASLGCTLVVSTPPGAIENPQAAIAAVQAHEQASTTPHPQPASLNQSPGSITDDQKEQFSDLHKLVMAAKGVGADPAARKAAWLETLKPFGVESIKDMSEETAARAIAEIGREHDPLSHPPSARSSSTT